MYKDLIYGRDRAQCDDVALGRYSDIAAEPPDQEFANLTRAPVRLLGLQPDNQALNLLRQLVGVAPDGVTDRSGPKARAPCSDRISVNAGAKMHRLAGAKIHQ
jgi:hypothetical protein